MEDLELLELDWDLTMLYLYKIQNGQEYFLCDIVDGATLWTTQLCKAIQFGMEDNVEQFIREYLPGRKDFNLTRR